MPPKWWSVTIDENCRLVVSGKWEGALEDGPGLSTQSWPSHDDLNLQDLTYYQDLADSLSTDGNPCKVTWHIAHMHGYPGPWDHLTHVEGAINFCYNGTAAVIDSHAGDCWGNNYGLWQRQYESQPQLDLFCSQKSFQNSVDVLTILVCS